MGLDLLDATCRVLQSALVVIAFASLVVALPSDTSGVTSRELPGLDLDEIRDDTSTPFQSQWEGCPQECGHLINSFCERKMRMCLNCNMYCLEGETYYSVEECKAECPAYRASLVTSDSPALPNTTQDTTTDEPTTGDYADEKSNSTTSNASNDAAHQNNNTTSSVPKLGKPTRRGVGFIVAVTVSMLVLLFGAIIYCRTMRSPPRQASPQSTEGVPQQTAEIASQKCYLKKITHLVTCGHLSANQEIKVRGVPEAEAMV